MNSLLEDAGTKQMKWETYRITPEGEAVQEKSLSLDALHQHDEAAYVLVFHSFKLIYIYIGRSAPPRLKFGASRFAKELQKKLGPIFRLKTIEQFDESQEFLQHLQKVSKSKDRRAREALTRRKDRQESKRSTSPQLRTKIKPVTFADTVNRQESLIESPPTSTSSMSSSTIARSIESPTTAAQHASRSSSDQQISSTTSSSSVARHPPETKATLKTPMTKEQKEINIFTDNASSAMFHLEGLAASTAIKVIDSSLLPNPQGGVYVRRLSWSAKKSTKVKDYQIKFYAIPRSESKGMKMKVTKMKPQFILKVDSANLIGTLKVDMYLPPEHDLYVAFRMDLSMTINFESTT